MKNRSHRYDMNRHRSRNGHKYSKYKKSLNVTMPLCIKQLLRFESAEFPFKAQLIKKLSNTEAELKKRVTYTVKPVYNGHCGYLKNLSAI